MDNSIKLYSVYSCSKKVYGLPFPGTLETMKRDVYDSVKGFDDDFLEDFQIAEIATFCPSAGYGVNPFKPCDSPVYHDVLAICRNMREKEKSDVEKTV